jgi:hypothetical protein
MPGADAFPPRPDPRIPSRRARTGPRATLVALAAIALSCSDFENLTLAIGDDGAVPDPVDGACVHAEPPEPAMLSAPVVGGVEFVVAMSQTDLGDALDAGPRPYASIGYDLDNACTSQGAGSSCKEPPWASADHADGPGGRDNAVGMGLYDVRAQNGGSASDLANSANATGNLELAIRVRNYNEVSVGGLVDVGIYGVVLRSTGDAGAPSPRWDGRDQFDAYTAWLAPPADGGTYDLDQPLYEDKNAYVTNADATGDGTTSSVLVSRFDRLFVGAAPGFPLAQVIMTAQIVKSGGTWSLRNGTFAGRIGIDDLLHTLAFGTDPVTDNVYCQGTGTYAAAKSQVCALADISLLGPGDASESCDAASWAWRFQTAPITLVGIAPVPPASTLMACSPGKSPADDHCP